MPAPRIASLLAALAFSLAAPRSAGAAQDSLDSFVADVLAHNPSIAARKLRRDAFRNEASAAGLWPDPSVSVMLDNIPRREGAEMPMLRYQLTQMVPFPGKLDLMESTVERQGEAAGAQLELRKLELTVEAKRGFFMLVLNARSREVNTAGQELVGTITRAALARFGAGTGGHHDVARAQVELSALEVERLDLEGERVSIVAMMNTLRNAPPARPIADPPDSGAPAIQASPAALTERALRDRPELAAMRAMQRESEAMGALARRERYPDLMASLWYNQDLEAPDTGGVMVGLSLPVFGIARQSRRAAAFDGRAAAAGQDLAAMQAMIRFEVADALRRVDTATRQADLLRDVAEPRVRESFSSSLAAYGAGTADLVGVLDARRSLQSITIARARARVQREVAIAELERAVGGRLAVSR